ncbi:MAG: hypothetical protein JW918_04730 [Anaerolineae bacterium]|nr:hypothetical protein [Anaerolineae bacterium]
MPFTSQISPTACGDWGRLYFSPNSAGYLDGAIVEYGVHAVEINTTNRITIANSTLRHNCHKPAAGDAWGAGLAIHAGTHLVTNTIIHDNQVEAGIGGNWAQGGGVEIKPLAGPTVFENCEVYLNVAGNLQSGKDAAGGGLNVQWTDPILRNCEVYSNSVYAETGRVFGGGVYLGESSAVIEAGTRIHGNTATSAWYGPAYGGGVCIGEAGMPVSPRPVIRDSQVTSNTATTGPGSTLGIFYGGGIAFYDNSSTRAIVSGTLIAGNVALNNLNASGFVCGGGIGMASGASADRFAGNLIRDNSTGNSGGLVLGGGICLLSTNDVTATNNLILGNEAFMGPARGGGVYADGPRSYLVNNTIVNNSTIGEGGGVYLANGVLSNTLVVDNYAYLDGGGVYWAGGSAGYNDVWGNTFDSQIDPLEDVGNYAAGGSPRPATDVYTDPLFIGSGDPATRYHLRLNSPCIDAGTSMGLVPGQDYDGDPRPRGSRHDIGFDEVRVRRTYLPLALRSY